MKYLIIGNGVAGTTAAENIRANDSDAWITIVTTEDIPFYYRIRLNDCLSGEIGKQGKIAGANMAGNKSIYKGTVLSSVLKVAGIDLASAGNIDEENQYESKIVADNNTYKKVVLEDHRVIGCIMLGDKKNFNRINKAIATREDILGELDSLLNA